MRYSSQVLFGGLIILIGVLLLISSLFDVDLGAICLPTFFIALGLWLIFRPRVETKFPNAHLLLLGDYRQRGNWQVKNQEYWSFIGNYGLEMQDALLPEGETTLRFTGFIHEIKLTLPEDVGVFVSSASFVSEIKVFGEKREGVIMPVEYESPNFASAGRKLRLECAGFVSTVKVRPPAL